jgi:hypothetical protein
MTEWCRVCRKHVPVFEVHEETAYRGRSEVAYSVTDLACGHRLEHERDAIGAAP